MANRGYDIVVDVDAEGELGETNLQEDLEFHNSNFDNGTGPKIQPDTRSSHNNPFSNPPNNPTPKRQMFSMAFYAQYFDVDTPEVLRRCFSALYPRNSFLDVLDGNPDLYGPFWIATTVVFILFLAGTLNWRVNGNNGGYDWGLLSGSAGLIYGYTGIVPIVLWGAVKWMGGESVSLIEGWCMYGYANLIWIPVAIISWSWINALNLVFVAIGFAISVTFLLRNLNPILSSTDVKASKILLIVVFVLHAGLAIAIKVLFFAHGSPIKSKQPKNDAPITSPSSGNSTGSGMF